LGVAIIGSFIYEQLLAMKTPVIFQKSPLVQKVGKGAYWWCACGKSAQQPFCDGSHKGTEFIPLQVDIQEEKTVAWCLCKHTHTAPFCDGSHKNL
jgi:CDGSH-type Zn-finger protein